MVLWIPCRSPRSVRIWCAAEVSVWMATLSRSSKKSVIATESCRAATSNFRHNLGICQCFHQGTSPIRVMPLSYPLSELLPNRWAAAARCTKVSPIESILQYHFATPKPLKKRLGSDRCKIAPLCKLSPNGKQN